MIKAVIFDMDGVLIDSEPLHHKIFKAYIHNKFGLMISDEEYNTFIGTTNKSIFTALQNRHGVKGNIDAYIEEYEEEYFAYLMTATGEKPIYGVDHLIKKLHQAGMRVALASSSPKKHIDIIVEMFGLNEFFAQKVSGQEVKRGKPAPDIFLRAAELLQVSPEECLVFEDSKNGIVAAKEAGMKCIAFYNRNSGNQDLSAADKIIYSFTEMLDQVELL